MESTQSNLANQQHAFIGVILAGGLSTRMGQDKALLSIDGKTMLDRKIALLKRLGANEVFVCRNEVGFLQDIYPQKGPMSGIHRALVESQNIFEKQSHRDEAKPLLTNKTIYSPLVILPIDMPLLDQDLLAELIDKGFEENTPLQFKEQQLPLFLPYSASVLAAATKVVTCDENRSIRRFLSLVGIQYIETENQQSFFNTNNQAQWHQAVELLRN